MSSHKVLRVLGVILALAAFTVGAPLVSHAGLIGYYSYDNADDLGADGSGNGYHGLVVGDDVTAAAGKLGGAAKFGAAIGNFIDLPVGDIKADGNIPTSNFTLAAWCNVVHKAADTNHAIFNAQAGDATFLIHPEIREGDYRFTLRSDGGIKIGDHYASSGSIFDDWHHVAMTWDRDTTTMTIYVDGAPVSKTDCADLDMAKDWDIGARIGLNTDNKRQYVGLMDELYLFNETLTEEQIGALASVPEPSSLVLAFGAVFSALLLRRKWNG